MLIAGILLLCLAGVASADTQLTFDITKPFSERWTGGSFYQLEGDIYFYFQGDANFVVYRGESPNPQNSLWNAGVVDSNCGSHDCHMEWQGDGNLVIYQDSTPLWDTQTSGRAYYLQLLNQAPYVVLYNQNKQELYPYDSTSNPNTPPYGTYPAPGCFPGEYQC